MLEQATAKSAEKSAYLKAPFGKESKHLSDQGVIRKFTVKIGVAEGAQAITLLATNPAYPTQEVSKKIQAIPNVETVYEVRANTTVVQLSAA